MPRCTAPLMGALGILLSTPAPAEGPPPDPPPARSPAPESKRLAGFQDGQNQATVPGNLGKTPSPGAHVLHEISARLAVQL